MKEINHHIVILQELSQKERAFFQLKTPESAAPPNHANKQPNRTPTSVRPQPPHREKEGQGLEANKTAGSQDDPRERISTPIPIPDSPRLNHPN
ncbi:MAG: hypothetical protein P1U77_09280 [Rubripirellula sp.]|nr:hypothetical protein [Rubripirellula sp.]